MAGSIFCRAAGFAWFAAAGLILVFSAWIAFARPSAPWVGLYCAWTTGASWRSGMAAALFAVHPMHVESVAWVAERKDVLSTFFALLALLAYVGYVKSLKRSEDLDPQNRRRNGVLWYLPVFALFALALLAKPMVVTLPCVMLLLDFWPLDRLSRRQVFRGNALPAKKPKEISRAAMAKERKKGGATGRPGRSRPRRRRRGRANGDGKPRPGSCWKRSRFSSWRRCRAGSLATQNKGGSVASADSLPFDLRFTTSRPRTSATWPAWFIPTPWRCSIPTTSACNGISREWSATVPVVR